MFDADALVLAQCGITVFNLYWSRSEIPSIYTTNCWSMGVAGNSDEDEPAAGFSISC